MRRAPKVDANQRTIVDALRKIGCSVQHLHAVGDGCPDLLVGYRGRCYLLEIKDGDKAPSAQKLTPDQERWHREWRGQATIVRSAGDAVRMILAWSKCG